MKPLLLAVVGPSGAPPPAGSLRWGTRCLDNTWSDINALKSGMLIRRMFSWATCQPTAGGPYVWSEPDSWIPAATAAGIPVMAVLSKAPAWATGGAGAGNKYPAGHQNDFYNFAAAAAARYPQVAYWEIYNEPDNTAASGPWTSAQVAEILIGAANAMVAARSTAKVIGLCTMMQFSRKQSFVNPILTALRGVSAIYGVSMHTYTRPNAPELAVGGDLVTQMATAVSMMDAAGFNGPLFVTEFGDPTTYSGSRLPSYVSEADAARWLVRQSIIQGSFARLERSIQFQLWGSSTAIEEGGMGLIRGANDRGGPGETSAGPAGSFKPGYVSYKNMMRILDETIVSITAQSTGPLYKYRFDKVGGAYGYIIWCLSGSLATTLTGLPANVLVTQNDGTSATVATTDGTLTISATVDPKYVEPIAAAPAWPSDTLATTPARNLWNYLNGLKGNTTNKVLSGQRWVDYNNRINSATGKYCAILNLGPGNAQDGTWANYMSDAAGRQNDALNWWNSGGVVLWDIFLRNPVSQGPHAVGTGLVSATEAGQILTEGHAYNNNLKYLLDKNANFLLWLQDRNVPVLVRNFIEHNGSGFWFLDNPRLIDLYRYCRNYIIGKGVHNALWIHCPSNWPGSGTQGPPSDPKQMLQFYPGDDAIDILGFDLYRDTPGTGTFVSSDYDAYNKYKERGKQQPIIICEYGVKTSYEDSTKVDMRRLINGIRSFAPDVVGYSCWSVTWSQDPAYNNNIAELLADPWIITRDEVPSL